MCRQPLKRPAAGSAMPQVVWRTPTVARWPVTTMALETVSEPQHREAALALRAAPRRLRRSAKLHHPRILRVQPEPVLPKPIRQHPKHPPRVVFVLEHQHQSSSRGESHPSALTEPDLRLSPHPALTLQPPAARRAATGRTTSGPVAQCVPTSTSTLALGGISTRRTGCGRDARAPRGAARDATGWRRAAPRARRSRWWRRGCRAGPPPSGPRRSASEISSRRTSGAARLPGRSRADRLRFPR